MVSTINTRMWSMARKHMCSEVYEPLANINGHTTPIFVENSHKRPFSIVPKANTFRVFDQEMVSTTNQRMWSMARKHMWVRFTSLWSMIHGHTTPTFVENSHERPFSIVPKANTFGFLTKKWSPPEIKKCDLWQRNICGVRFTILW
jgi:hypothetical protein